MIFIIVILYFLDLVSTKLSSILWGIIMKLFNTASFDLQLTTHQRSKVLSWSSSKAGSLAPRQKCLQLIARPGHQPRCFETHSHFPHSVFVSSDVIVKTEKREAIQYLHHKLSCPPLESSNYPSPRLFLIPSLSGI